jgi:hypothetical protein
MKNSVLLLIFLLSLAALNQDFASNNQVDEGFFIFDKTGQWLKYFKVHEDLTVDHLQSGYGFEIYGPRGLGQHLKNNEIPHKSLPEIRGSTLSRYPTPEEIETDLKSIATSYPNLAKLYSIGQSGQGRNLWVMKLALNPQVDDQTDPRPQFKYIANMHGVEIVGRELMVLFITDLLQQYGKDPLVTNILNKIQLHILVSMNPDGAIRGRRGNATGVDLNRNFPDFSTEDNQNTRKGRAPETQAVMQWQASHRFVLSANFHGGAEVVNYPWDTIEELFPENNLIKTLSLEYAQNAPYIGASTVFQNGITNGFLWYEVNGGMQDWSIHWHKDLQVTIELSNMKWPDYDQIPYYYQQNRAALFKMASRLLTADN